MKRYCYGLFTFAFLCVTFVWAQTPTEFKGHPDGLIHCVAISNDGTLLATASVDGTAKIWNYASGKETQILKGHAGQVRTVAFNKDGTIVATGGSDAAIRFWNPKDGKTTKEFANAHKGGVECVTFSPDGSTLASTGADMSVKIWDVMGQKEIKNLGAHTKTTYSVVFNAAGTELASCGADGVIKIWDVKGQKEIKSMLVDIPKKKEDPKKEEPKKEEPKKDDKDKKPKKDMAKKEDPKPLPEAFHSVVFSQDGKFVISGGSDKYVRYWNIAEGKETKKIGPSNDWIMALAVSKDGKNLAAAGYGGSLRVYDLATGNQLYPEKGKEKEIDSKRRAWMTYSAVFSPDGKSVLTGHEKSERGGLGNVVKVTAISK